MKLYHITTVRDTVTGGVAGWCQLSLNTAVHFWAIGVKKQSAMVTYILVTHIDQGVKGYQIPSRYVAHISTTKSFVANSFLVFKKLSLLAVVTRREAWFFAWLLQSCCCRDENSCINVKVWISAFYANTWNKVEIPTHRKLLLLGIVKK